MIGCSIMMWFVSIVLLFIAVSLLKGNTALVHGKVFEQTADKPAFAKRMGKPCLLLCIAIFAFGTAALFLKSGSAPLCALGALLAVVTAAFLWMMKIQRGFQKLLPKK